VLTGRGPGECGVGCQLRGILVQRLAEQRRFGLFGAPKDRGCSAERDARIPYVMTFEIQSHRD
jgi:hypothetical protein